MKNDEYKIVKILDNKTIVINAGSEHGIEINDIFEIIGKGSEIKDPETNESLGFLDNIKETVSAIKIFPKMCVCSHISENSSIIDMAIRVNGFYNSKYKKILNIDEEQIINESDEMDKILRIGDIAKKKTNINEYKSTNN